MKWLLTALLLCHSTSAHAQDFSANDVSILLQAPVTASDPRLPVAQSLISSALAAKAAAVVAVVNGLPGAVQAIDASLLSSRRNDWHVAALRVDPGAPGGHEAFMPFGRNLQIRLTVQPVNFTGTPSVRDEAVHLVYSFGAAATDAERAAASCAFRVAPTPADVTAFRAALADIAALKNELTAAGIDTTGALGVHPAFARPETAALLIERLSTFVARHLTEERLSALSVAGLPADAPEPWVFLALTRTKDGFAPVPGPAIEQRETDPLRQSYQQMLSFVPPGTGGKVLPPGRTRNRLPVDCLANFLPGMPQPDASAGVSTSELFGGSRIDAARTREIAAIVADPATSHFFNTDCVSCHAETRRQMDAGPDPATVGAMIAAEEGIVARDLPRNADGLPAGFDKWNVRAFGWFPGFPATTGRAHATVTRRAARETAEVVSCLNEGDWTRLDQPCLTSDAGLTLDQGWSDDIRRSFYHTSQGGAIMPLDWFLALERPGTTERFATPENLSRYGALPSATDEHNPHGLPVGFAVTGMGAAAQVGLNCAACHVGEVVANGQRLRVDGAPAAFDFDAFTQDLSRAMQQTAQMTLARTPTPQLARFMANVASGGTDPGDPQAFVDQAFVDKVLAFAARFSGEMAQRSPKHPSGPGRVDALTQIINSLAVKDLGVAANLATPSAPTSYPPLWLADRLEFVQWNLAGADPLARNIGQALGVFGTAVLSGPAAFSSSADVPSLERYEQWISDLSPPRWPEDLLGPIDEGLARQGRDLFAAHCEDCHNAPPFRQTEPGQNKAGQTFIAVKAVSLAEMKTDSEYTRAFTERWVASDGLAPAAGLPPITPAARYLAAVVGGVTKKARAAGAGGVPRLRPAGHPDCGDHTREPCGYNPPMMGAALKAGPLLGLWTTGPYLHNGSVRTVYQVISPPEERETSFMIGDRVLDPGHLGFANSNPKGAYLFDTSLPGNGNGGHILPSPLTHDERMSIVEYLKDPERFPVIR